MKKILILITVLFTMISCREQPDTNVYHEVKRTNDVYIVYGAHFRTVVIDGCEYLIGSNGYLSHKGNCKYCAERRKRELENAK